MPGIITGLKLFDTFGDVFSGVTTLLSATGLIHRDGNSKWAMTEQGKAAVTKISPNIFGIGQKDEVLHLDGFAKLHDSMRRRWWANLHSLPSKDDKALVILSMATIPEIDDRVRAMEALAQLDPVQFRQYAADFRLIPADDDLVRQIRTWLRTEGRRFARRHWRTIRTRSIEYWRRIDAEAGRMATRVNNRIAPIEAQEATDRIRRKNRSWLAGLFGDYWPL